MALTERQEQVKVLQDAGRTPTEIGKALNISTNAVYQQLRRMHSSGKTPARRKPKAKATTPAARAVARARAAGPVAPLTPLQAIRARKDEINHELRAATSAHQQASVLAKKAQAAAAALTAKRSDELKALDRAESALTGRPVIRPVERARKRPARKTARSSSNGSGGPHAAKAVTAATS